MARELPPALRTAWSRLERDLKTRFDEPTVSFTYFDDGWVYDWDGIARGGDDYFTEDRGWSSQDIEAGVVHLAAFVCDHLWPEHLTDPWPTCPVHQDHSLDPCLVRGSAVWACSRDPTVAIEIGRLPRS